MPGKIWYENNLKGVSPMLYRKMNRIDRKLSILGFGCMRLPQTSDFTIDETKATAMVRYAIDRGVNYIDTAYVYHNGQSESFLGRALADGYREKINLATKMPVWDIESRKDMDRILDEQLKRLNTDHIDFYLLHGLSRSSWNDMVDLNVGEFLDGAIADGRIGCAGFSFHDNIQSFKEIVDAYPWTFAQIQYNYMDEGYQAGTEGLNYAAEKGLGLVIMEPLRGGVLARETAEIKKIWASGGKSRTAAEWSLRWLWNRPEITVVLSGMSTMQQVKDNLGYAHAGKPSSLTVDEIAVYEQVKTFYRSRLKIPCTRCRYCLPCMGGVDIPECFSAYNDAFIYKDTAGAKFSYDAFTGTGGDASQCQECGVCESLGPQQIPIRERLKEVVALFGH
ncbi:MAG: aldo/keto reductase [Methanoregula sp.]|nr:aldo/keto reductase [Methanoregula sp.]